MALPHIVPLSRQAIELIQALQLLTGNKQFVFYNPALQNRWQQCSFKTAARWAIQVK